MPKDPRIVFGANCTWWESIDKASKIIGTDMPCCPRCHSVLFEVANEEVWWRDIENYDSQQRPGYRKYMEWAKGKCFPGGFEEAWLVYQEEITKGIRNHDDAHVQKDKQH